MERERSVLLFGSLHGRLHHSSIQYGLAVIGKADGAMFLQRMEVCQRLPLHAFGGIGGTVDTDGGLCAPVKYIL